MIDVTKGDLQIVWENLSDLYRCQMFDKGSAVETRVISYFLSQLGILDSGTFLDNYATTLGTRIYLPFELGDPSEIPLDRQLEVLCHELKHVSQYMEAARTSHEVFWALRYLIDPVFRAAQEAEALVVEAAVRHLLGGALPDPVETAQQLQVYKLRQNEIDTVSVHLRLAYKSIRNGVLPKGAIIDTVQGVVGVKG